MKRFHIRESPTFARKNESGDTATEKVMLAGSTEELVEVSYALHLDLAGYAGSSRNVREARQRFETAVKEKTVELYSAPHTKK